MAQTIGKIQLDLGINSSGFKQELNGITKTAKASTNSMAGMFGKLGKAMVAAFAVGKIVAFSKECIQLGSDLAEVQNVVNVTFGSMSSKVDEFAKSAMTSYGLSEKVAKQYMGTFGAMSKAFGYTTEAAYEQAAALTGLAGDVASFYNLTTDEAYTKLKSVFTGETESLKDLGVVMTQTALDEYALQKGMGKTTSEMSEQEKVALRLAFVQDRLATASGDFARTSDGWANQTRVLALRFDALKASIGQGLINMLLPIVQVLNDIIGYAQAAADAFRDFTAALFGDAGGSDSPASAMSGASAELAANMDESAGSAKAIKKSLAGFDQLNILSSNKDTSSSAGGSSSGTGVSPSGNKDKVEEENKYVKVLKQMKTELKEIAQITGASNAWSGFLTGMNGFKTGMSNLGALAKQACSNISTEFDALKTSLATTFTTVSTTLTTIWGDIWSTMGTKFATFTEEYAPQIETFLTNLGTVFTDFGLLASTAINDIFGSLKTWWESDGSRIFGEICDVVSDVGGIFMQLYNEWVFPVIQGLKDTLAELWTDSIKPLWDNVLAFITSLWDAIKALWENPLKPIITWLIDVLAPGVTAVVTSIYKIVKDIIGGIIDFVKDIISAAKGLLDFITGIFTGDWKKAWTGIKDFFGGIWDAMVDYLKMPLNLIIGLFEGLINAIIGTLNGVIRAINKLSFDVPDWVPLIGGEHFGFNLKEIGSVDLPRLATGGYVAANTPQLAVIGDNKREGEIVAPESKIAEAVAVGVSTAMRQFVGLMNNNSSNKQGAPLVIKIGEDDFWSGFIDYHNGVVKRTGDSPLLI